MKTLMQHQLFLEPYAASGDHVTLENLQQSHVTNKSRHLAGAVECKAVLWNVACLPGVTWYLNTSGKERKGEKSENSY